ncbi:MAG: fimbrial assembly protein [Terracidiphilus sp.]
MRITLNLATRPFADLGPAIKRLRIAMGALAGVSILLGFGLHLVHSKAEQARARVHSLDGAIARVTNEREGYTNLMHQPANAQLLTQAGVLNQLFDEKGFSWTLAMEDLETVLPGGVQVTSLEPIRDKEGVITLHLRVKGPRNREVELVQNLEHSRRFLSPRIVGENAESNEGGPNQQLQPVTASSPFDFDLLAEYNPATASELIQAKKAASEAKNEAGGTEQPHAEARPSPVRPSSAMHLTPNGQQPGRAPYAGTSRPLQRPGFPPQRPVFRPETSAPPQGGPQ